MNFNLADMKQKLMHTFGLGEMETDDILAYLQQGMAAAPMLAQVLPPLFEMAFEVMGNFKPLIEKPKGFATQLDIDRFTKYLNDGHMTREEALALTIARMNRNTSINIRNGSKAKTCVATADKAFGNIDNSDRPVVKSDDEDKDVAESDS